jgi:hypothetical protein
VSGSLIVQVNVKSVPQEGYFSLRNSLVSIPAAADKIQTGRTQAQKQKQIT